MIEISQYLFFKVVRLINFIKYNNYTKINHIPLYKINMD